MWYLKFRDLSLGPGLSANPYVLETVANCTTSIPNPYEPTSCRSLFVCVVNNLDSITQLDFSSGSSTLGFVRCFLAST